VRANVGSLSRSVNRAQRWWAGVGSLAVACVALPACGLILDLDHGVPAGEPDASLDGSHPDVSSEGGGDEAGQGSYDAVAIEDAFTLEDGRKPDAARGEADAPSLECTPDLSWCDSHCGTGPDNCGQSRACAIDCTPQGYVCGTTNTCECQTEASWCTARCGLLMDNCGRPIDCGPCDAGGCDAEPESVACGTKQCGQAVNNCNQTVNCGLLRTGLCAQPLQEICLSGGGCCAPQSSAACGNQCGTFATDNCGRSVQCPSSCGSGRVCVQQACCTPVNPCSGACGVTKTDNCGQTVQCGCTGAQECTAASACCTPQGCGGDCVDSCGLQAPSCCIDADVDSGIDAGVNEAGSPEAGALDSGVSTPDASEGGPSDD